MAANIVISEEPPALKKGSVRPITGVSPRAHSDVLQSLRHQHGRRSGADKHAHGAV